MGKGDKKSKRGKISKGSYGVRRPRKKAKSYVATEKPKKKAAAKKTEAKAEKPKKATTKKSTTKTKSTK